GGERGRDGLRARVDRVAKPVLPEERSYRVADDVIGLKIGERAAHAPARLDPHLPRLRRGDEEDAVVGALAAELPGVEHLVGEILDLLALERASDERGDLDSVA